VRRSHASDASVSGAHVLRAVAPHGYAFFAPYRAANAKNRQGLQLHAGRVRRFKYKPYCMAASAGRASRPRRAVQGVSGQVKERMLLAARTGPDPNLRPLLLFPEARVPPTPPPPARPTTLLRQVAQCCRCSPCLHIKRRIGMCSAPVTWRPSGSLQASRQPVLARRACGARCAPIRAQAGCLWLLCYALLCHTHGAATGA